MKYKLIVLILILLTSISNLISANTYSISGTVTDFESGETLISAIIRVDGIPNLGAISNKYGFYSLTLEEGEYNLIIRYIGYKTMIKKVIVKSNESINFSLSLDTKLTNEIIVSAERNNQSIISSDIGIKKIEMSEIEKIPVLFGERDVMKTLRLTPGVKSIGEGNGGMYVRGGDNSQNLIILDEAVVYNASHLLGFFSTFNSDAIKDVTLYKGTAPADFGGRLASVLDIKMNEGNNKEYKLSGGIGLISSRLNVEGPIVKDKGSFLVTARRTYADLIYNAIEGTENELYFYDINAKANYKITDDDKIFVSGYFGRDFVNFSNRFGIDWGNATGTLRWNHIWSNKLFSNTSLIYSDYDYRIQVVGEADKFNISSVIQNLTFKQEFQYFLNNQHIFEFGINSIYHSIIPGQVENIGDTVVSTVKLHEKIAWENALYLSGTWKPSDKWNINYGVRVNIFNLLGPGQFYSYNSIGEVQDTFHFESNETVKQYINPEPRINAAYIIDESMSLKLSYTRNTQNLHLISNSTSSTPTDLWIPTSQNVKPEISDQLSFGYFQNFINNEYELSLETYYKWMQNQLDLKNGAEIRANELIEGELLFGDGRAYGLEFLLKKKLGKLSGWIGYTYSNTEKKINGINENNWYPAKQDIIHDICVVGIYEYNDKWSFSATWVYNTGNAVTFPSGKYEVNNNVQYYYTERNGYRMPDYHRLDIGATLYLSKAENFESSLSFSVYNVYGRKNAYTIEFEVDPKDPTKTQAVKTYLFTYIPSISYNFKF